MQIFRSLDDVQLGPTACAIGMFDGVHLGHRLVLEQAIREAKINNLTPVIFTFANHPQSVVSQTPTPLLSTLEERLDACKQLGFEAALVLDFTPELRDLSAHDFVQKILIDTLAVKAVSVGYDHRFGKGRKGDGAFLKDEGIHHGFIVEIVDPVKVADQIVSSTLIRKLLSFGDLKKAIELLGRPYSVTGVVGHGEGRGARLGFPTANLEIPAERLIPAKGVYAGRAIVENKIYPAVCNVGYAPTFGDNTELKIEVHLLEESGNLYGKNITFEFLDYIRDEQVFPSVDALIKQLHDDCKQAKEVVANWK